MLPATKSDYSDDRALNLHNPEIERIKTVLNVSQVKTKW